MAVVENVGGSTSPPTASAISPAIYIRPGRLRAPITKATYSNERCVDLFVDSPDATLCDYAHIEAYLKYLFLPWRRMKGRMIVACANPNGPARRKIAELFGERAIVVRTGKAALLHAAQVLFRERLLHDAAFQLDERIPHFSARRAATPKQLCVGAVAIAAIFTMVVAIPQGLTALLVTLAMVCFASIAFRMFLFCSTPGQVGFRVSRSDLALMDEAKLPVYSILVPLYREANVLPRLVDALASLDYPAEKLDIKLILEEDDRETCDVAQALDLDARFEILRVPPAEPRTKPKATNYGLRFARGEFVVIFDAEDSPERDQLKKAVAAFRKLPETVACLQARLNFYNLRDNWLTRMFAIEYAAWFDYLLPGLARFGMPIPLGGTSNHFRAGILRKLHGWDAFNVTEDADLGIRMVRQGYRVLPLDSSTYEEAPSSLDGWIRQRSRWLKGYMQTVLVHSRLPREFIRAVGLAQFLVFFLFLGCAVLTNILSPLFWLAYLACMMGYAPLPADTSPALQVSFHCLVLGNVILTVLAMLAPLKRRWMHLIPYGATVFVYGVLISAASYRALRQFVTDRFYWEKTQHGLTPVPRGDAPLYKLRLRWVAPACFFALLISTIAYANPWLKEEGDGETILSVIVAANPAGLAPAGRSANAAGHIHLEYGATETVTLVLDSDATYDKPSETWAPARMRFDTAWLGARVALVRWDDAVLSIEGAGGLAGLHDAVSARQILSLNGAAQIRLLFGQGFTLLNRHAFMSMESGWRWRGGAPADEWTLDMTVGIEPWRGGLFMLQSFSALSTSEARVPYRRFDTHKVQVSVAQELSEDVSIQLGLIDTLSSTDARTSGGIVALWWRF